MLVLSMVQDDVVEIWLPDGRIVEVNFAERRGDKIRMGFIADTDILIFRKKVADAIRRENRAAAAPSAVQTAAGAVDLVGKPGGYVAPDRLAAGMAAAAKA